MTIEELRKIPLSGLMPMGAIIGDICGSKYEGRHSGIKHMPETLIDDDCIFTDDTVMTVACANGISRGLKKINYESFVDNYKYQDIIRSEINDCIKEFALKYPHAGYGRAFKNWLKNGCRKPYGSFGNGSAMRCSFAGWAADSLDEAKILGRLTAEPTHDHPLGRNNIKHDF